MPTYLTVKDLADIFRTTDKTIRRWIDEGKDITFDDLRYTPSKDPGGNWLFIVRAIVPLTSPADEVRHPVPLRPRRRVISNGVK